MKMAGKSRARLNLVGALKDRSGSMTFFVAMLFTTMIGVAGIAVDIARFEASRTEIQSHLDNATLAAASLRQTSTPTQIVTDYMTTAGLTATYDVQVTNEVATITYRRVEATASVSLDTFFMKLFGVDDLDLVVESAAEERVPHVEVSLVLDISGSMDGSRLNNLKPAAKEFVDLLLQANDVTNPNRISISLIPYNMQVNAGAELFEQVYGAPDHSHSYCAEWSSSAFDELGFSSDKMNQAVHMGYKNAGNSSSNYTMGFLDQPYCRDEAAGQILPFSFDAVELKGQIDDLSARGNTSIDIGVKWGAALLDPSARDEISHLAGLWKVDVNDPNGGYETDSEGNYIPLNRQSVDPGFDGRPVDYDDDVTMKVLVVMTDGENTTEYRVKSSKRGNGGSGVYYNPTTDDYRFSYTSNNDYYQKSWTELWADMPLYSYLKEMGGSWTSYWDYNLGNSQKNTRLSDICQESRDAGVVIFSIAYSATTNGKTALKNCAGNESFYHEASTSNISEVFAEIGGVIEKLKLVQ
jgi:Flp pilus assembly protein TadG